MKVTHRPHPRPETHFSEGEPDLEPPEELAVAELDEELLLEEDLETEALAEDDVDDEVLAVTLEDLAHAADDDEDEDPDAAPGEFRCRGCLQVRTRQELADAEAGLCRTCSS